MQSDGPFASVAIDFSQLTDGLRFLVLQRLRRAITVYAYAFIEHNTGKPVPCAGNVAMSAVDLRLSWWLPI